MPIILTLVLFLSILALLIFTGLKLPQDAEEVIDDVIEKGPEEQHIGETGYAMNGKVKIFYESIGDPKNETVLMIHGHSAPAIFWPLYFVKEIVKAGYHVVRYDNRGVGQSDWIKDWSRSNPYTLEDMAQDGIAVLDHLNIEKAHIVGCSMGGMISQRITLSYPDRVYSLCSIMSSGYFFDKKLTQITPWLVLGFARSILRWASIKDEKRYLKMSLGIRSVLHGNPKDFEDTRAGADESLYVLRHRGGISLNTRRQHSAAIKASGSRLEELAKISVPTAVIHGTNDPLILPQHAEKYGPLIPDANVVWIEGLGHMLAKKHTPEIVQSMVENFKRCREKEETPTQKAS